MCMGIKINPRMHTGTAKIPLCIRGSRCNPHMHAGIACHVIPVYAYGDQDVIPICIRGLILIPVCILGFAQSPYAYGDRMDTNPRMHMEICASPYAYIAVRARRERRRATYVESSFSRKRQHDDGRAARSRLVAIKQFSKQAPHPPHH